MKHPGSRLALLVVLTAMTMACENKSKKSAAAEGSSAGNAIYMKYGDPPPGEARDAGKEIELKSQTFGWGATDKSGTAIAKTQVGSPSPGVALTGKALVDSGTPIPLAPKTVPLQTKP